MKPCPNERCQRQLMYMTVCRWCGQEVESPFSMFQIVVFLAIIVLIGIMIGVGIAAP